MEREQVSSSPAADTSNQYLAQNSEPLTETTGSSYIEGIKFSPMDLSQAAPPRFSGLAPSVWAIIHSAPANFLPQHFLAASRNLLENPNLTSSLLHRAELSYTSFTDATYNPTATHAHELAGVVKHLKPDHQPRLVEGGVEGYELEWTVVRKLVSRNPKLDKALLQTCHLFTSTEPVTIRSSNNGEEVEEKEVKAERNLIIYLPHAATPSDIPFYHPKVRGVAILYIFLPNTPSHTARGTLSIFYDLFPEMPPDNRMQRTALKLLETVHKHAQGRMTGYQKRVHHDVVIPQKAFQDTYVYLKGKYAKRLIEGWVEQTPAEKHVFEDLGIAAFLVELWVGMYGGDDELEEKDDAVNIEEDEQSKDDKRRRRAQDSFPGFVDIGCGNGLLVYILNTEGWKGWGFDARRRKTWDTFADEYQKSLKEMLLIPEVLNTRPITDDLPPINPPPSSNTLPAADGQPIFNSPPSHNGVFPPSTFIISNHADELTPWTPLLAHLSSSPFIAIPCCSHNLGGARYRTPFYAEYFPTTTPRSAKQVSAYAGLCSYVAHLTDTMGYKVEKEYLRIPSTRNVAVLGRRAKKGRDGEGLGDGKGWEERLRFVRGVVEKEMGGETTIEQVKLQWLKSGAGLLKPGKGGH